MNNNSRTRNSIYNFAVTIITGVLLPLFGLIKYSLFIGNYGTEINGIQITMESVIAIINIFEVCFSLAFRQLLFKPLIENDKDSVNDIYSAGVKIFKIAGIVFLVVGVVIGVCFPLFSDSPFSFGETVFYFILLMIPYGISYFIMGPNFVLIADQKEYKINIWIQTIAVLRMILMIIVIILKLPVVIIFVIESLQILIANFVSRRIALKMYPWLEFKKVTSGFKKLIDNIKYTFIQRLEVVATTNVDTFVISIFMNYTSASIYGAYNYIIDNISKIINKALETTLNSFGNLFNSNDEKYNVFLEFFEFVSFIASLCGVCVCLFFNDFLAVWIKNVSGTFVASETVIIALSFNIFYMILRESFIIGRDANGLFKQAKNNAIIYVVCKIVLCVILIKLYGISGAIVSTAIVNVLIDFTYNPRLLCKNSFESKTKEFYTKMLSRTLIAVTVGIGLYFVKESLFSSWNVSYMHFFISAACIGLLALIIFFVIYFVAIKSFRQFVYRIKNNLSRR